MGSKAKPAARPAFRPLYLLAGLALAPVCAVVLRVFFFLILAIPGEDDFWLPLPLAAFAGGMGAWLLLATFIKVPTRAYILAHELTHALWGMMMGARASRIRVGPERGSVLLSKTNFLIVLAPYFFPLYAVLIMIAYGVANLFVAAERYETLWLALVGLAWGFHLTFTASALTCRQSDVREFGRLFSWTLILTCNALGMTLWLIMTTAVTWQQAVAIAQQDLLKVVSLLRPMEW
jgi:hypothetical protein